jgi:tRNA-(ms[2]io[6]A)-hydroxylase
MTARTRLPDLSALLAFLRCRSPDAWVRSAVAGLDLLLLDHATLELKAAQQAQRLIWKYGMAAGRSALTPAVRSRLIARMSRLAREELRHFEQVVALIERRGGHYEAIPPSRYASGLHAVARTREPGALVDTLIIGAVIEARSCERFLCLIEPLRNDEPELAAFYASLLRSEARHFEDYLDLARRVATEPIDMRIASFLERDAELLAAPDRELRFHSGPPGPG